MHNLAKLTRNDITAMLQKSALRFGERNPQQFQHLQSQLSKAPAIETLHGLLQIFTLHAPKASYPEQELAGMLLAALKPEAELPQLQPLLLATLGQWNLSVEQLPYFLAEHFGVDTVLEALQELAMGELSADQQRGLAAMRFWLAPKRK